MGTDRHVSAGPLVDRWPTLFPSTRRVYQLAEYGVLPCIRIGRRVFFDLERIEEWIASGGKALAGGWRREQAQEDVSP